MKKNVNVKKAIKYVFFSWLLSEVFSNSEKIDQLSWRNFPHIVFVELPMKYKKVEFCNTNNESRKS